jgi:YD repeat-containing protein
MNLLIANKFRLALLWLAIFGILFAVPTQAQQGGNASYVYDNAGRLRAVISPAGEAAVYDYDPAGNFTAIRRLASDKLEVLEFSPRQGTTGTLVTLYGVGFNGQNNAVTFNGVAARILNQTATTIVAEVPSGATTGTLTINSNRGTSTTPKPFTVKGVGLFPSIITIASGSTLQFTSAVALTGDQSVKWSVNAIDNGNTTVGTINSTGFYTAPNLTSTAVNGTATTFIVRVRSVADPTLFAESLVTVLSQGSGFMPIAKGVSVRYGNPPANLSPAFVTAAVSVSRDPAISSLKIIKNGGTETLTITGFNLSGAIEVKFINTDASTETKITVTNPTVNAGGTVLTATVNIDASLTTGSRYALVTTPTGHSQNAFLIANSLVFIPYSSFQMSASR